MIDVDRLRTIVNTDLARKDHAGGFMSSDEFNRLVNVAQEMLFDYFFEREDEQMVRDALSPFYRTKRLPSTDGHSFTLPSDYNKKLDIWVGNLSSCADNTLYIPVEIPARNELSRTLSSPVRGPSLAREVVVGRLKESVLDIWPNIVSPYTLNIAYYIGLPQALRAYTVNPTTDEEELDAANTVNLAWRDDQIVDFIDVLLLFKGMTLRSSSFLEWVQAKKVLV